MLQEHLAIGQDALFTKCYWTGRFVADLLLDKKGLGAGLSEGLISFHFCDLTVTSQNMNTKIGLTGEPITALPGREPITALPG